MIRKAVIVVLMLGAVMTGLGWVSTLLAQVRVVPLQLGVHANNLAC